MKTGKNCKMNKLNKIKKETLIDEVIDVLVSDTYDIMFEYVADAIHEYKIPYGEEHGGLVDLHDEIMEKLLNAITTRDDTTRPR